MESESNKSRRKNSDPTSQVGKSLISKMEGKSGGAGGGGSRVGQWKEGMDRQGSKANKARKEEKANKLKQSFANDLAMFKARDTKASGATGTTDQTETGVLANKVNVDNNVWGAEGLEDMAVSSETVVAGK